MEIQEQIEKRAREIDTILNKYLPVEQGYQKTVLKAMNYSVLSGGKRLRPMLMQETYRMLGGKGSVVEPFMAAIEMIHTYSLVHDDLPSMDNDYYRRGRKTTHAVYGEGMAVLAGDGLLNYAFETAMKAFDSCRVEDVMIVERYDAVARALRVLAEKAGIYGMIGGQTADIEAENSTEPLAKEQLLFIHEHKTAALVQSAMMTGAILAGADDKTVAQMEKCAYNIGVAFQIQDDILDVEGEESMLGKPVGSDTRNGKQTYVSQNGLEKSKEDVAVMSEEAVRILEQMDGEHTFLSELIVHLIHREK